MTAKDYAKKNIKLFKIERVGKKDAQFFFENGDTLYFYDKRIQKAFKDFKNLITSETIQMAKWKNNV
jgi:hypothetical protein